MDTDDPFDDDLSDFTPEEREEIRRYQAEEWAIEPDPDLELTEREWQRFRVRMGWDKPGT